MFSTEQPGPREGPPHFETSSSENIAAAGDGRSPVRLANPAQHVLAEAASQRGHSTPSGVTRQLRARCRREKIRGTTRNPETADRSPASDDNSIPAECR